MEESKQLEKQAKAEPLFSFHKDNYLLFISCGKVELQGIQNNYWKSLRIMF